MALTYREWQEGDDLRLLEIFTDPDDHQVQADRSMLQGPSEDPWLVSLVACDDEIPVGAGVCFQSKLHPDRCWIYVEVAKPLRGQGIGAELLRQLTELHAEAASAGRVPQALQARYAVAPVRNEAAHALASRLGMGPIQTSKDIAVQPHAVPVPDFGSTEIAPRHVTDIATGSVELMFALHAFYTRAHESWSPSAMTAVRASQLFLSPESGAHGALVVRRGAEPAEGSDTKPGPIRAFAVSYPAKDPEGAPDVFLGYDWDLSEDEQIRALADLLGLIAAEHPVRVEVDESMAPLVKITDALIADGRAAVETHTVIVATDAAAPEGA